MASILCRDHGQTDFQSFSSSGLDAHTPSTTSSTASETVEDELAANWSVHLETKESIIIRWCPVKSRHDYTLKIWHQVSKRIPTVQFSASSAIFRILHECRWAGPDQKGLFQTPDIQCLIGPRSSTNGPEDYSKHNDNDLWNMESEGSEF